MVKPERDSNIQVLNRLGAWCNGSASGLHPLSGGSIPSVLILGEVIELKKYSHIKVGA